MTVLAHFEAGPSALPRVLICTASVQASRGLPDTGSEAADVGTRRHDLLEVCIHSRRTPADFPTDGEWAIYTEDDREAVTEVVEYVRDLLQEYPGELYAELPVSLEHLFPGMFGRIDFCIVSGRTLILGDAKFGRHQIDANTPQLRAYALGLIHHFEFLDFDDVVCVIAQPACQHYDEVSYTPDELQAWAESVMVPKLEEAFGDSPTYTPDDKACRFCRARAVCAPRKAAVFDPVAAALDAAPDEVARIPPDQIGELLRKFDACEKFIGDVREYSIRELIAGRAIPGQKLVEGRSTRKWADPSAVCEELAIALQAKKPDLAHTDAVAAVTVVAPITITAAEKLLGKTNPVFSALTKKSPGKATLAPESDPRPAYAPTEAVSDALDAVEI